jgi:hypothetical protein
MDADVGRALAGDPELLHDVMATVEEGKASAHEACPSPESWLCLVADLRISCSILP